MPRLLSLTLAGILIGLIVGVPLAYGTWHFYQYRNFHVVEDGVLYRSGQLPIEGLQRLIHDHGIRTVVTLRYATSEDQPAPDLAEELFCKQQGLHHFRLPFRAWEAKDEQGVPAEVNVKKFLEIMADKRNHPVVVHCFAGIHRTGTFCAIYRMEFDGWTSEQAIREMRDLGFTAHYRDVLGYLESYRLKGYGAKVNDHVRAVDLPMKLASQPPYTIGPRDVLYVDSIGLARPKCPFTRDAFEGHYLVRADGTISLGLYGVADVAGSTLTQTKCILEKKLGEYFVEPKVSVDVAAHCDTYSIVIHTDQGQQVFKMPFKQNETVLDAIGHVKELTKIDFRMHICLHRRRPSSADCVLPVDLKAITEAGSCDTNYLLFPGDRLYLEAASRR